MKLSMRLNRPFVSAPTPPSRRDLPDRADSHSGSRARNQIVNVVLVLFSSLVTTGAFAGAETLPSRTPVLVTASATAPDVDSGLDADGAITGTVTAATTATPLSGVSVTVYSSTGEFVRSGLTDAAGYFSVARLPAGTYYARTQVNFFQNFLDELYDNIPCPMLCAVTTGTPIVVPAGGTRPGVDFALIAGGSITGAVTDAVTHLGMGSVSVGIYDSHGSGLQFMITTAGTGAFTATQLTAGSYFALAYTAGSSYVSQLYNNIACADFCTLTAGTPIAVKAESVTSGIDFALSHPLVIASVVPDSGQQGQTIAAVALTGVSTHLVNGVTSAHFGAGITVISTTVTDATHATAEVIIAPNTALGGRTVTMTTGAEAALLVNGFTVTGKTPILTKVTPSGARRGRTNVVVGLTGQVTHFLQGVTAATFGAEITVTDTTVLSPTQATATVTIPVGATLGPRTVALTTGAEVVALPGAFVVGPVALTTGDFDGDSHADLTVFRPSTGEWHTMRSSSGTPTAFAWGNSADRQVVGDFDGDGKTDIAVFRPSNGTWYIVPSTTGVPYGFAWGNGADITVPGDYDGDGKTDIAVFRPSNGTWYIVPSTTGVPYAFAWGNSADICGPGDYDGDGKTDIAVFRPSNGTWYVVPSTTGVAYGFAWGNSADRPVAADYDGDGRTDIAVFRPSNGTWYVVPTTTGVAYGFAWGNSADICVPGDYDGDGKTDIAVFRPSTGTWFIVPSTTGAPYGFAWGNGADIPIFRRP